MNIKADHSRAVLAGILLMSGFSGCSSEPGKKDSEVNAAWQYNAPEAVADGNASSQATVAESRDNRDPWEGWNRHVQTLNDKLDHHVMTPLAEGYKWVTPHFVDRGVSNFFSNVDDVSVVVYDLMQFKMLQSGKDLGRLLVNTTAGLGGFVDVASMVSLNKHYEDFDQTMAVWGVPTGPYLVLPFFGPSSPRGVFGIAGDIATNPINYINPLWVPYGANSVRLVDARGDLLSASKIADEAAVDRYEFIRNAYFQQRQYLQHDGQVPAGTEAGGFDWESEMELQGAEDREKAASPAPAAK